MKIAVASGKGGTGKTTVAVNLALSLEGRVKVLDCDVEEPNAHIFLHPEILHERTVYSPIPRIDDELCDYCGKCAEFCEYNALAVVPGEVLVFPELCHSCGGCMLVCPRKAITEELKEIGVVKKGIVGDIELVFGVLKIGEPIPVPLIREVKREIDGDELVIIDSPPGTSCPVIHSIHGSDYCILVTEPTPFGLHDLRLMVDVVKEMKIPFGVVVNRAGIGDRKVYDYCERENIPILMEIPFERRMAELYSKGIPLIEGVPGWRERFRSLYTKVGEELGR